jgi:hypothetical protein
MSYEVSSSRLFSQRDQYLDHSDDLRTFTELDVVEGARDRYPRNITAIASPQGREVARFWDEHLGIDSRDLANIVAGYSAEPIGKFHLIANNQVVYEREIWSLPFVDFPRALVPMTALAFTQLSVVVVTDDPTDEFILASKSVVLAAKPRRKVMCIDLLLDFGDGPFRVSNGSMFKV